MKKDNYKFGKEGEQEAIKYLKNKGYCILDINWHFHRYEIDIIARKEDIIAIVEVKTRATGYFGNPEDAVNRKKRDRIIKSANAYIEEKNLDVEVRFDIASVLKTKDKTKLNYIEDAFMSFES